MNNTSYTIISIDTRIEGLRKEAASLWWQIRRLPSSDHTRAFERGIISGIKIGIMSEIRSLEFLRKYAEIDAGYVEF